MLAALTLAAADGPPAADPNHADLHCVAVFAAASGSGQEAPDLTAGLVGALMYYVGRIDARDPRYDLEGQLVRLLGTEGFKARFPVEAKRCGAEMEKRGREIEAMGKAIQNAEGGSSPQG